jgi:hypothetical protein
VHFVAAAVMRDYSQELAACYAVVAVVETYAPEELDVTLRAY